MKRYILSLTIGMISFLNGFSAQTGDAFKGVWPVTDKSIQKSLNGEWQLKVIKGISADNTVPEADASWGRIPVPGCWEAYGFCEPKYDYPDSLTGYYRAQFTIPSEWKSQQVVIRLDGVLRCQALKQTPVRLTKGSHKLYIKALDDHIIVDQWMVDFNKERKFYVISVM